MKRPEFVAGRFAEVARNVNCVFVDHLAQLKKVLFGSRYILMIFCPIIDMFMAYSLSELARSFSGLDAALRPQPGARRQSGKLARQSVEYALHDTVT